MCCFQPPFSLRVATKTKPNIFLNNNNKKNRTKSKNKNLFESTGVLSRSGEISRPRFKRRGKTREIRSVSKTHFLSGLMMFSKVVAKWLRS